MLRLALAAMLSGCGLLGCEKPDPPKPPTVPPTRGPAWAPPRVFDSYPSNLDHAAYAGAAACAPCHGPQFTEWRGSQHGRATLPASPAAVLADFGVPPKPTEGGVVSFARDGDRFFMEPRSLRAGGRFPVDLAIASGRQHQVYLTRDARDGVLRILPMIWSTLGDEWVPTSLYQPGSVAPDSRDHWRDSDLAMAGCANCHMSQGRYRRSEDGKAIRVDWIDPQINCESCHGPGRAHAEARTRGEPGPALRDLAAIGKDEEARLCGVCHANRADWRADEAEDGWPWFAYRTLADPYVRPDGTQTRTAYQYSAHVMSECFQRGAVMCKSCHDPHTGAARSLADESAEGAASDLQCMACHRDQPSERAKRAHSRHPAKAKLRCIDCHMALSWIGDNPGRRQLTSDHTISTPRPAETVATGIPNACNTCHKDKTPAWALGALTRWGKRAALEPRPWVLAIHRGRTRAPGAAKDLTALLRAEGTGTYLRVSALELLANQAPDVEAIRATREDAKHPDPLVRGQALVTLTITDKANAERWRKQGCRDPHPYVRMRTFPLAKGPKVLTRGELERFAEDTLDWRQRPGVSDLILLAAIHTARGEHARALELVDIADRWSTPKQRRQEDFLSARRKINLRMKARGSAHNPGSGRKKTR